MNSKNNKGITLIIMVITIMVMLILATIFIITTVDDVTIRSAENVVNLNNDLINKTKDSEKDLLIKNTINFTVED